MENYEYERPQVNRDTGAKIKRLRRKNRNKSIWIGILLFVILLLMIAIGISYANYYRKTYKEPSFEYYSMTEEASARAFVWLNKIEDTDLSYEDVKDCMGQINLEVVKKPTDVKGEYTYEIAEGAYEYCFNQANLGFEKAYYMAIENRIKKSEYEGEVTDELVDRIMNDTFGISVPDYLGRHEIKLLPDENDIDIEKLLESKNNIEKEATDEENN